jgi:hypothetical protein
MMSYEGKEPSAAASSLGEAASGQPGLLLDVKRELCGTEPAFHHSGAMVILVSLPCVGDCGEDGQVTVDEVLTMVELALGNSPVSNCPRGDSCGDDQITVDEILTAVNNALNGCA